MIDKKCILPQSFYWDQDVLAISRALLGKCLLTFVDNQLTGGIIVETEAYYGVEDKACHAFNNRRTERTSTMYLAGGVAYVYLCYGIHHLLNIVTATLDVPHAVLIRAIQPVEGVSLMLKRRNMKTLQARLTAGPGALTQALGITRVHNGCSLTQTPIWLEERGIQVKKKEIITSPRVGIDYAQEYRDKPWRFRIKDNPWTSKAC